MIHRFKLKNLGTYLTILMMALAIISCSSDDDAVQPADSPSLSIEGDNTAIIKVGETMTVNLNLTAPRGNKSLVVNKNGGLLEEIAINASQNSYTYTNQSVPDDAEEGEEHRLEFILVDQQNQESAPVTYTAFTAVYDEVSVSGEMLYDATVTMDGIVPSGTNMKLISGRNYFIGSSLTFEGGTSLTIEKGVTVYIDANAGQLIEITVDNGATVSIVGTATEPIVFTSSKVLDGSAKAGDWERFRYGNVKDGTFQYVRSEYATTGVRFGDADDSNTIDHIASYNAVGEGIYMTNGNVNAKYLVAVNSEGGGFRLGDSYTGKLQFGISWISETFDSNQELDIRETASPTLANFTLLGPGEDADNTHGVRLRTSSQGKIYNSLVAEFPRRGVRLNDDVNVTDLNGETIFAYSYVVNVPKDPFRDDTNNGNPFQGYIDADDTFQNPFFNNITGLDSKGKPILEDDVPGIGVGDFIPDSPIATKAAFDPKSINSWFTSVNYVGAIEDEANDWTVGWVKNPDGSIR